jgi:hypothetical protein
VLLQQQLVHEGGDGWRNDAWLGFSSRQCSSSCLCGLHERQVGDTYNALLDDSGSSNRECRAIGGGAGGFIFDDGSMHGATLIRVAAATLLHTEEFGSATRVLVGAGQDHVDFGRALLDLIMDWA